MASSLAAVALLSTLLASPAKAELATAARMTWRPTASLGAGRGPQVASGRGGRVVVTWSDDLTGALTSVTRRPGGLFSTPTRARDAGVAVDVVLEADDVAVAALSWFDDTLDEGPPPGEIGPSTECCWHTRAARTRGPRRFRAPQTLSKGTALDEQAPQLALSPTRTSAGVLFSPPSGGPESALAEPRVSVQRVGRRFGRPVKVGTGVIAEPHLALDADGRPWVVADDAAGIEIYTQRRHRFHRVKRVGRGTRGGVGFETPTMAFDSSGDALIAWTTCSAVGRCRVEARWRTAAGKFGRIQTLARPGGQNGQAWQYNLSLAMNPLGDAVVTWATDNGADQFQIRAATATRPGRRLRPARHIGDGYTPQTAINRRGSAVVLWSNNASFGHSETLASLGSARTAHFGPPHSVAMDAASEDVTIDDRGRVVVVWDRNNEVFAAVRR